MYFKNIIENAIDAICVINEDNIIEYVNPAFLNLTGYTQDELIQKDFSLVLPPEIAPLHKGLIHTFIAGKSESKVLGKLRRLDIRTKSGEFVAIELKAFEIPTETSEKRQFAGVIRDIRDRLKVAFEHDRLLYGLNDLGYLDEVTHLPNQKFIYFRFETYLQSESKEGIFALIDVDGLENVNKQYGRVCGDELLQKIGKEIQINLRVKDTLSRWENSTLAVILPMTSLSEAIQVLDKLRADISRSKGFLQEDPRFIPSISIGCSRVTVPKQSMDIYISQANEALAKAKREGKNKLFIFGFYSG